MYETVEVSLENWISFVVYVFMYIIHIECGTNYLSTEAVISTLPIFSILGERRQNYCWRCTQGTYQIKYQLYAYTAFLGKEGKTTVEDALKVRIKSNINSTLTQRSWGKKAKLLLKMHSRYVSNHISTLPIFSVLGERRQNYCWRCTQGMYQIIYQLYTYTAFLGKEGKTTVEDALKVSSQTLLLPILSTKSYICVWLYIAQLPSSSQAIDHSHNWRIHLEDRSGTAYHPIEHVQSNY